MGQMETAIQTLSDISIPEEGGAAALTSTSSKLAKKLRGESPKDMQLLGLPTDVKRALKAASIFLSPADRKLVTSFIQAGRSSLAEASPIVGILKQMKDTFQQNLVNAQAGEAAAVETHTTYMDTATEQYDTMQTALDGKNDLLGSNDGDLGTAKSA